MKPEKNKWARLWPRLGIKPTVSLTMGIAILVLAGILGYRFRVQEKVKQTDHRNSTLSLPLRRELMWYYLEIELDGGAVTRATGVEPLLVEGSASFRFHFKPRDRGYLYIIVPSKGNIPTTFLTARPDADTGVTTNLIEAGADYIFPAGSDRGIALGEFGNTTLFTILFSPAPLAKPKFLSARAYQPLTTNEQRELESLWREFGKEAPDLVPQISGNQASVAVAVPADHPGDRPLIFDIPIKRH